MSEKFQAIRGMNDILPEACTSWQNLEDAFAQCMQQYGYQEIRFPLLENTNLFKRSIGEVTDIVEKEMYTFSDLNGDSITLRPEGTASCVRVCLEHGLLHNQHQRLWYFGPMFRHEKPQKGRYRQFYQFGVEAFGFSGIEAEVEMIAMTWRLWKNLGIADHVKLEINSLGSFAERQQYKAKLVEFLKKHLDQLDADSIRRLDKNPLRILDSKNPQIQALLTKAPKLFDELSSDHQNMFQALCQNLEALGIAYRLNPYLVRGLDYYSHTVFEWVTDQLGSQATICAGGRYDALLNQLGGKEMPAFGLAMGAERVLLLMETLDARFKKDQPKSLYVVTSDTEKNAGIRGLLIAEKLRNHFPDWQIVMNTTGGSFKSQFKKADKINADYAIIIGSEELLKNAVSIKNLKVKEEQVLVSENNLFDFFTGKE